MKDIHHELREDILPEWTKSAVLLYGPRKAGTSLLLNLLDGGDELLCVPGEVKLKIYSRLIFSTFDHQDNYFANSVMSINESSNFDSENYWQYIRELRNCVPVSLKHKLQQNIYIMNICVGNGENVPAMWALKEVSGDPQRVIGCFRQHFMAGPVIMIFRDPLKITASILRNRRRRGISIGFRKLIKHIKDPLYVMTYMKQYINAPGVFCLTYEEITGENYREVLDNICEFLKIKKFERLYEPTVFGEKTIVRTSSKPVSHIFSDTNTWWHNLPLWQIFIVYIFHTIVRIKLAVTGQRFGKYVDLQSSISNSRTNILQNHV